MVNPVIVLCRQLQANKVRAAGMSVLADKLEARAKLPLEHFSADLISMIEHHLARSNDSGGGGGRRGRGGRDRNGGDRPTLPTNRFRCFKCRQTIQIPAGVTKKDAITEHRKLC